MKIIDKKAAMAIQRQHPDSRIFRYCTGSVLAVYAERRRDNHGPYTRLICITTN